MVTTTSKDAGHCGREDVITTSHAPNHQHSSTNPQRPYMKYRHAPENEQAITSKSEDEDEDEGANSDEFDFVERDVQEPCGIRPTPTYHYPNTWSTALTHTTTAFSPVTTSTSSYLHSLTNSGVTKAGLSIGGALAATANRTALGVASKAVGSAGMEGRLPTSVRSWLKEKEKLDEQRQRAEMKEGERKARKIKMELIKRKELIEVAPGWCYDPKASKSRAVSMVSRRGSSISQGDEYGDMVGGQRGRSTRRRSTPSGLRGELAKLKIVEGNRDEDGEGLRIKSPSQNRNPWFENSKPNSPIIPSPLSSSPGFERVPVQIDTPTCLPTSPTVASLFLGQGLVESPFFNDDSDHEKNSHYRGWSPASAFAVSRKSSIAATKPQLSFQKAPEQKKVHRKEKVNETKDKEREEEDNGSDD